MVKLILLLHDKGLNSLMEHQLQANDVVFSGYRLANPAFGAPYAQLLANVLNYQAIAKNKSQLTT